MRIVILGTGTNVGKSYVTAALARGLRTHTSVLALKPVESGVDPGVPGDAGTIAEAAGHAPALSGWRYARPVSPHLGARAQGRPIELAQVARWISEQEDSAKPEVSLIETAGGALSPLGPGLNNVALASALAPALWLLVAPDSLGVLHDVAATLAALPRPPDALVLSGARPPDESSGTNAAELAALGIAQVLECIPPGAAACPTTVEWALSQLARSPARGPNTTG